MNYLKHTITVCSILLASFIWGWKQDSISSKINSLLSKKAFFLQEEKTEKEQLPLAENQERLNPEQAPTNQPIEPEANNPYKALMDLERKSKPSQPNSLVETLDSIRPNKIDDKKQIQKNAYFEKLSQQLKELRGENVKQNSSPSAVEAAPYPPSPYPSSAYPTSPYPPSPYGNTPYNPSSAAPAWNAQGQPDQIPQYPQANYIQQPPSPDYQQMMQNQAAGSMYEYGNPSPYEAPDYNAEATE